MIGLPSLRGRKAVPHRTAGELDSMAAAGALVAKALLAVRQAAQPGVSTLDTLVDTAGRRQPSRCT